jgi:V/A-type H+/Na+-transporting ATPase subunit F
MVKMAVLGSNEFTVGFQLAGIKDIINLKENSFKELREIKHRKDLGIVVLDEKILEGIGLQDRVEIENSVDPVFIPVSTKVEQDSLKRLIKKSIGVDLWK